MRLEEVGAGLFSRGAGLVSRGKRGGQSATHNTPKNAYLVNGISSLFPAGQAFAQVRGHNWMMLGQQAQPCAGVRTLR
jgi:hypothetical protein